MTAQGDIRFNTYLYACGKASWPEPLWNMTLKYILAEGFARFSYHHLPPLGAPDEGHIRIEAHGYPRDWLRAMSTKCCIESIRSRRGDGQRIALSVE